MLQILSFIFLAFVVATIWGILEFDGNKGKMILSIRNGIFAFLGILGIAVGLGVIISIIS